MKLLNYSLWILLSNDDQEVNGSTDRVILELISIVGGIYK